MGHIALSGLDAGSALAWMAGVGTLRVLSPTMPSLRLAWTHRGAWMPVLYGDEALAPEVVLDGLVDNLTDAEDTRWAFDRPNIQKYAPEEWREVLWRYNTDPVLGWWLAALSGETERKDLAPAMSMWITLTGASRQDWFTTCQHLARDTGRDHLTRALFETWDYGDVKRSLRWDGDERLHAYRAGDPSNEEAETMWGANRLALEALDLFPTVPGDGTTGWSGRQLRLPIWEAPLGLDSIRTLVAQVWREDADLKQRGVASIMAYERHAADKGLRTIRRGQAI